MKDFELTPEIVAGARTLQLGNALLELRIALEQAKKTASFAAHSAELAEKPEIVKEVTAVLEDLALTQKRLQNPQVQEWTAAGDPIPPF